MIGATREKLTLFITLALDTHALSGVCGINLQYHCNTVSRASVQSLFCLPEEKIVAEKESTSETVFQVNS